MVQHQESFILLFFLIIIPPIYILVTRHDPIFCNSTSRARISNLLDLLSAWHNFASSRDIEYCVFAGTALGWYRENSLIPYDLDADVLIPQEDMEKVAPLMEEFYSYYFHFKIQPDWERLPNLNYPGSNKSNIRRSEGVGFQAPNARFYGGGVRMDVFSAFQLPGEKVVVPSKYFGVNFVSRSAFFPSIPCEISGIKFKCPRNVTEYLKMAYLDWGNRTEKCERGIWIKIEKEKKNGK